MLTLKFWNSLALLALLLPLGLKAEEAEPKPKPVSDTVTIQLFTVFTDDSFFRPRISWDRMFAKAWSTSLSGDFHLSVDVKGPAYVADVFLAVEGGVRYWFRRSGTPSGGLLGLSMEKTIYSQYTHVVREPGDWEYIYSYGVAPGFLLDQQLNIKAELGWQWLPKDRYAILLRAYTALYDDTSRLGRIPSPNVGFQAGWAW